MVLIVQDYDASSSTISHAYKRTFGANFARIYSKTKVVQNKYKDKKNTSWAKKQKLLFLHAIS